MKIHFLGASRSTTGSQYLLEVNDHKILLDCGYFTDFDKPEMAYYQNRHFSFDPADVDALILSHAHIDHSGNIPRLVKEGFRGDIVCSYATRDLCSIVLTHHARSLLNQSESANRFKKRSSSANERPPYSILDVIEAMKHMVGIGYERTYQILPGIYLNLYDAGHMLGSSIIVLDIQDTEQRKDIRLVYSGDLGRFAEDSVLRPPTFIDKADIVLIESTYGDRLYDHDFHDTTDGILRNTINETVSRGGKVIIAASAIGTVQELVFRLNRLSYNNEIAQALPMFVDCPLAIDATAIHRLHPETFSDSLDRFLDGKSDGDPFSIENLYYTRTAAASKELHFLGTPAVIISTGKDASYGRILHHLRYSVEDPRNAFVFTGIQSPNTVGRKLMERQTSIRILGKEYASRSYLIPLYGVSGHADQKDLLKWISGFGNSIQRVFVVHGDKPEIFRFAKILQRWGVPRVTVPYLGQSFKI